MAAVVYAGGLASIGLAQSPLPGGARILQGPSTNGLSSVTILLPSEAVSAGVNSGLAMQSSTPGDQPQPSCVPCPPSAVSWWPAEGDASDAFDRHNGVPQNGLALAAGEVGQAFSLNGSGQASDQGPSPFAGSAFDAEFDITLLDGPGGTAIAHGTPTKRHNKIVTTEQGNGFDVAYMNTPQNSTLGFTFSDPLGPVWVGMQGAVDTLYQAGMALAGARDLRVFL